MSLFTRYYYHGSAELYTYVMACLFKDIKIYTEGKLVTIPISYFGGKHNTVEDVSKSRVLPRGLLKFEGIEKNPEGQLNKHGPRLRASTGLNAATQRVKNSFEFTVQFSCKHSVDAFQLIEQVVPAFDPTLDFEINETESFKIKQNIKVKLESYMISDNYEGDGEEASRHNVEFKFKLDGYLYRKPDIVGIIKTIHLHLTIDDETGEVINDWIKVNEDGSVNYG